MRAPKLLLSAWVFVIPKKGKKGFDTFYCTTLQMAFSQSSSYLDECD